MPDIDKVRELQSKVMKDIAAGAIIPIMMIGDELGLLKNCMSLDLVHQKSLQKK